MSKVASAMNNWYNIDEFKVATRIYFGGMYKSNKLSSYVTLKT